MNKKIYGIMYLETSINDVKKCKLVSSVAMTWEQQAIHCSDWRQNRFSNFKLTLSVLVEKINNIGYL